MAKLNDFWFNIIIKNIGERIGVRPNKSFHALSVQGIPMDSVKEHVQNWNHTNILVIDVLWKLE